MKSFILAAAAPPAAALLALTVGCSSAPTDETEATSTQAQAVSACPTITASDPQMRAAATVAFSLMRDAVKAGSVGAPAFANTILASQRYRVQSSGTGIEFDPADPLYPYVSNQMKADLAFAQLDTSVAQFLSDGLKNAYAIADGWQYPLVESIGVLANYSYPGPNTIHIDDPTSQNNYHNATITGQLWCNTSAVTITEAVQQSYQYSPLFSQPITNPWPASAGWIYRPPAAFKGTRRIPTTPFNGNSSSGNPYLVISVNGTATNWATYNFSPVSCWGQGSNNQCNGTIQIDPVPYAEPGQYYNTAGLVGTQANPFQLLNTTLYAVPDHQMQWATRTVNGVQEWGTFATPITLFGVTQYKYAKQM